VDLQGGGKSPHSSSNSSTDAGIVIRSLARVVIPASADIYVAMRISPSGMIFIHLPSAVTDESRSKNCTKHNCRCPYMDMPPPEERNVTPEKPDLLWTPEIEAEIERWQKTGVFPFPELCYPQPNPQGSSVEDLRLIYHVASISTELALHDAGTFTIWTSQIPL